MKYGFLAWTIAFLQASAMAGPLENDAWLEVARAAQAQVEYAQQGEVIYVVSDAVPIEGRRALSKLRKVVRPDEVVPVAGYALPPGYVVIHSFDVFADSALISANGGPIRGKSIVDCGYNIRVPLKLVEGRWLAEHAPVAVC